MRTVIFKNIEYEQYASIFDILISEIPWALLNQGYSPRLKTGFFNFWDSDYIPENMKKFIAQPPVSREDKERLINKISEFIKNVE